MVSNKNLKVMEYPVVDEFEGIAVLDIMSIAHGVYGAEISDEPTDANDGLHVKVLFDANMTSEHNINKVLDRFLNDEDELEEFYMELALNDQHCDVDELKRMGYFTDKFVIED